MNRNTLFASLAVSLFVVAAKAQANDSANAPATGTIMEDVHPGGGRAPLEDLSVFPSQGPAD